MAGRLRNLGMIDHQMLPGDVDPLLQSLLITLASGADFQFIINELLLLMRDICLSSNESSPAACW